MPIYKKYNQDFFKKYSSEMAYILGFLFADGNIIKTKRNTCFIAFYTKDRSLLVSMRRAIGSSHKLSKQSSETGHVYRIQIGSLEFFKDLNALGLTENKARRMRMPKIPEKYMGDFIRGYFDGDGSVWSGWSHKGRKTQTHVLQVCFTSASIDFLGDLLGVLKKLGLAGGSLFASRQGNYARLLFSSLDALKLHEVMYNKPHTLLLERKKRVFDRFIKMRV